MQKFRQVKKNYPVALAGGKSAALGQVITLTNAEANDPHTQSLVEQGVLVVIKPEKKAESGTAAEATNGGK